jgi:hypothetical protein
MTMINCLSALPANLVGVHAFGFLSLASLGRLDAAVAHHGHRLAVLEAISFVSTTVPLLRPDEVNSEVNSEDESLRNSMAIWRWCAERSVTLREVQFSDINNGEDLKLLERLMYRVPQSGVVRFLCDLDAYVTDPTNIALLSDSVKSRITHFSLSTSRIPRVQMWKWGSMQNVMALGVNGDTAEPMLKQLLLGISALERVEFSGCSLSSFDTVQALCGHSASLTSMSLRDARCHPELLRTVGQSCHSLEKLLVTNRKPGNRDPLWTNEQAWVAVAQGCRLTAISTSGVAGLTETALLAFAAHCATLKILSINVCDTTITDAVLLALAKGCPKLVKLEADSWAIKTVATVDTAQSFLSRLEVCPFDSFAATPPTVLARAVSYLQSVELLSLQELSVSYVEALCGTAVALDRCEVLSLHGDYDQRVAVDDLVVAVAAVCPQLQQLNLSYGTHISEPALLRVAGLCRDIQDVKILRCDLGKLPEAALLALIRSWPRLTQFYVAGNRAFTDTILRAMAEQCPSLQDLELAQNTKVTVEALLEVMELLPNCEFVAPDSFSATDELRIYNKQVAP